MKRLLVQSLFILVLASISGSNVVAWLNGYMPMLSHSEEIEQVLEMKDEPADHSLGAGGPEGAGVDSDEDSAQDRFPIPAEALFYFDQAHILSLCRFASVRQLQANLVISFLAPALFILFHSYQGYLS